MGDGGIELRSRAGRAEAPGPRARAERIDGAARAQWAAAASETDRLSVADDRLAALARAAQRAGVDPGEALRRAIRVMWAAGDALVAELEGREVGRG